MRIQERWFLRVLAGFWILGGVGLFTSALNLPSTTNTTTTTTVSSDGNVPSVEPLQAETTTVTTEMKLNYTKDQEGGKTPMGENKKKAVIDFKPKGDQKYKSPAKDDFASKFSQQAEVPGTNSTTMTLNSTLDNNNSTKLPTGTENSIPFLLHGEPIVANVTRIPADGSEGFSTTHKTPEITQTGEGNNSSRGRALNVSAAEPANSLHANLTDLSDVSMDENDKEVEGGEYVSMMHNNETMPINLSATLLPTAASSCVAGNRSYSVGESIVRGCDEKCTCGENGKIVDCRPICPKPQIKAGSGVKDPLCYEKQVAEEPCCAVLVCTVDTAPEPDETCSIGNKTVSRGERIEDGCDRICVCEIAGSLKCQPRCPPNETANVNQHDRCVALADPRDACCTITLCDVTLGDHEIRLENSADLSVNLSDVKVLNSTAIKLKLSAKNPQDVTIEVSENKHIWWQTKPDKDGIVSKLEPARTYYVRVTENGKVGPPVQVSLPAEVIKAVIADKNTDKLSDKNSCTYRGKIYKIGAEWYDDCISYCSCAGSNKTECVTIECPTDFGLDVLDPHCLDWETVPPNFVPQAPHCCPQEVRCRDNGSCVHEGKVYDNWSTLPGPTCGSTCHCDMGKIYCEDSCPPVPAFPPYNLPCPQNQATLDFLPGDTCCKHWACKDPSSNGPDLHVPPGFQVPGGFPGLGSPDDVEIQNLEALDESTVRLVFTVPRVLVGLQGRVELRYTSDKTNNDPSTWMTQVFVPTDDFIATQQLEFELTDLKPATEYKIKITVKLNNLANSPSSKIYSVRTLDKQLEITTLPPQIPIDAELEVMEKNSTWVKVMWKKFTEYELQFIDGVQLRYKEQDGKVYAATPLIHRAVTNYIIEDLKPSTVYEIGIYFIPFPGQATELISEKTIQITTSTEPDPYSFDVKVEIKAVKPTEVEVSWNGVPYPEDKYVNIYRAIYQSDTGKEDTSTFKIAKRDSPAKTIIGDLKPGTRYRLWIEVYLTNGRIKKSNVQDFVTKPGVLLSANISQQTGKLASLPLHEGDYYGPLVIVAIVASLAILSTLILLMMLMKRRSSSKADISPRKTTSAYDNPSYKTCEDATTVRNGRNKTTTEHEMATINIDAKETA